MLDQSQISEKLIGLVVFELDNKEFCVDINEVSAILNPREVEKIGDSLSPGFCIRLNEFIIPVIDLRRVLGIKYKNKSKNIRFIMIELSDNLFAFMVERVKEIFTVNASLKDKMNFEPEAGNYLLGKICYEGRELFMPDFRKIIESQN